MGERYVRAADEQTASDLGLFLGRVVRIDDSALVRLKRRADGMVAAWATTAGFDVLAGRALRAEISPSDLAVGAAGLRDALAAGSDDPGFGMDAAWRGSLPPDTGFDHVDDVPARAVVQLAADGAELAVENSTSVGPPRSLLDQTVLEVSGGGHEVEVPLRALFALTAMGFVPGAVQGADGKADLSQVSAEEPVRVRATRTWVRLDGRFGSVCLRAGGDIPLLIG